ncbi:MAG TPA: methyltransferase domain-containing protein, partial [Acidimicrobiales bacterium]|nr:methyltransferase domain-containing protein [Acidimicrobiales bacterium]
CWGTEAIPVVDADGRVRRVEAAGRRWSADMVVLAAGAPGAAARVLGADLDAEQPWIATEYVAGPTLRDAPEGVDLRALAAGAPGAPIEVVHGAYEDPRLPDGQVDLVLVSSVYHHIEDRVPYFARLRGDLAPGGRVAILEPATGLASLMLLLSPFHAVSVAEMREEMAAAGYQHAASHDFLPAHSFEVFALPPP